MLHVHQVHEGLFLNVCRRSHRRNHDKNETRKRFLPNLLWRILLCYYFEVRTIIFLYVVSLHWTPQTALVCFAHCDVIFQHGLFPSILQWLDTVSLPHPFRASRFRVSSQRERRAKNSTTGRAVAELGSSGTQCSSWDRQRDSERAANATSAVFRSYCYSGRRAKQRKPIKSNQPVECVGC